MAPEIGTSSMPVPAQAATTASTATPATTPAPSTESSQVDSATSEATANGNETQTETTQTPPSWREAMLAADRNEALQALLDSTDSEVLLKQPKLSGLLGDLAERRARAKEAEIEKRVLDRQEQERLRKLRDEDPYAYAQEQKRVEEQATQSATTTAEHQRVISAWAADVNNEITELARTLPKEMIEKLAAKKYEGTLGQGLRAYVTDIIDASKESWTAAAQERFKTELLPTLRKEALALANGGESPDATSGGTTPSGALSNEEWARNGNDRIWRQANKARINEALSRGAIQPLS